MTPNVGDLVEYGRGPDWTGKEPGLYRVDGWVRAEGPRQRWCTRREATHVLLRGFRQTVAPVDQVKVVGQVDWPREIIEQEQIRADRLGAMKEALT